ncbi:major facilitator superfamily domain-containing protein [Bipolaris maydis]|uniref:major facilitator superfamily domain-containing protein n=1 Tax=Cochliobolus heterostrophus TaxID=5016 RepID=UPI0024D2212A|nr:major facilitator superfamily domain-containing protein [Bipolaris maydis]KAJ6272409.1 major facilitator superfamily domain-containing protein [Bipolaris maydis]
MARDVMDDSASKDHTYTMEEVPNEKASLSGLPDHLHQAMRAGLSQEDAEFLYSVDKAEQKKIFHKVDWRLCPMLAVLYLISHLDRANIGNAKIEGLEKTLGMKGTDYNVALMVFFVPYVLFEIPSNMILAKFKRPSYYMGTLTLCWGTVMTVMGLVQNLAGLCATRFFLGLFEAGFFPGAIYLVGQWYPPDRTQFRMALFYCASATSGAFSGLLAAAIAKMNGIAGLEGWRWIFILEGIATVLLGASVFFLLPDSPDHAAGRWLTADEARFLRLTHIVTRGVKRERYVNADGKKERVKWGVIGQVAKDWQIYLQAMVFASNAVPNYGLKFTMPQILKNMGFTSTTAQLMTAPPYACGAISALLSSLLADRFTWRMPFIASGQALLIVAYAILFAKAEAIKDNVAVCYFAVHVACIGLYPILPGCNAWTINNLAGPEKRAVGIATMICIGNLGGIVGSFIFQEKESPKYETGFGSSLSFAAAGLVCAFTLEFLFFRINKKNAEKTEEEWRAIYTPAQLEKMGDRSPLFKYHL